MLGLIITDSAEAPLYEEKDVQGPSGPSRLGIVGLEEIQAVCPNFPDADM